MKPIIALEKPTKYYETILQSGREVYAIIGVDGLIKYKSPSLETVFGYKPEEIVGLPGDHLIHPDDRNRQEGTLEKVDRNPGQPYRIETRYHHKEKGYRLVEGFITNYKHVPEINGYVISYYDVTERNQMYKALNESREHLDLALRGADLGIWDWDLKTGKIFYNKRWAQMLGYSLDEIDHEEGFWEDLLHPDDAGSVQKALNDHIAGDVPFYETEHRLKTKSGDWKWVLDRGRVMAWDEDGTAIRAAGTHQDIDKRKRAELELLSTSEALARINEELEHFAYLTSHNLRGPVVNLMALLSHLDQEKITDSDNRDILEKVTRVTQQLHSTLDDLIHLVSLQDDEKQALSEIRFESVIDRVTSQLQMDIAAVEAQVSFDFSKAPSIVYPRNHLDSIFLNLISNAIKYRSPSRKLTLNVTSYSEEEYTVLTFQDNGSGLDLKKHGKRIFEMHQRFHHQDTGKGLGLFIVKKQLQSLDGKIDVESMPDKGCTFTIYLRNQ